MSKSDKQGENRPKRKAPKTAFKPGQSGNPKGRPKKGFAISERIRAKVSDKDWDEIIEKATAQAKDGDKFARDFLIDRTDGKAINTISIIEHDPDEIAEIGG